MKKVLLSIALLLVAVGVQAQIKEFTEMGKIKGVEYTYADSEGMKSMMESGSGIHMPGINIDAMMKGLLAEVLPYVSCIQSVKAEDSKVGKKLLKEFDKFLKNHQRDYEPISNLAHDEITIRVYNGLKGGGVVCTNLGSHVVLVAVSGEKSLSELMAFFKNKYRRR